MVELGQPAEWKSVDVVLAGASLDDLGLYYYEDSRDRERPPLGWIPLHDAHIDTLEVSDNLPAVKGNGRGTDRV
jgi:hypothetical protein